MLKLPTSTIQLGHYKPGHGTKGKKRYITIEEMKKLHERKVVLLWCYNPFIVQPANTQNCLLTAESDIEPKVKV